MRKDLFWLVASVVAVCGRLVTLLWAGGKAEYYIGERGGAEQLTSWWTGIRESKRKGQGTRCIFPGHTSSDLPPPTRPTSYLPPPPNAAIILGTHQGINPLIRSESSGSSHFPKAHQLAAKALNSWISHREYFILKPQQSQEYAVKRQQSELRTSH
jgi:hypothetical protein